MPSRLLYSTLLLTFVLIPVIGSAQAPTASDIEKAKSMTLPDDPAAVVAVVGETEILLGDLKPKIDARINSVLAQTKQEIPEEQLHFARLNLTRGLLAQAIQNKMMRESFLLDQIGGQAAAKRQEAAEMMSSRARQMFYEKEVPQLKKKHKVHDLVALDEILRKSGGSLSARERDFADAMLGHMYMRSSIEQEPNVTLAEIAEYYAQNRDDYKHAAKARWEQLTVLFSNHDREEASRLIREMGREAYFGGNVQAVAKAKSEEPFADEGGLHEWTNQGSLSSKKIDEQVFTLPLNAMSQVFEDETGFHIIRILDRKPAGVTPLKELQDEIKKKIQADKVAKAQADMVEAMQARVPVWTIYPDDVPGSKPLPQTPQIATRPDAPTYR